jgi:riboflavin biosynthesis pyrimidine reductase
LMRQLLPVPRPVEDDADLESIFAMPPGHRLRANFITSVDGAIELDGRSRSLSGPADRAAFMAMRAGADVLLVGAGTVRAENYGPVKLNEATRQRRVDRGQPPLPRLAVVSGAADLDPNAKVFSGDIKPLLLTSAKAADSRPDLAQVAEVTVCGDDVVDLGYAFGRLSDLGLPRVLCEGGPTLLIGLLAHHLVDELCLTISPVLAGSGHRSLTTGHPLPEPAWFELSGLIEGDGMLLSRYGRAVNG